MKIILTVLAFIFGLGGQGCATASESSMAVEVAFSVGTQKTEVQKKLNNNGSLKFKIYYKGVLYDCLKFETKDSNEFICFLFKNDQLVSILPYKDLNNLWNEYAGYIKSIPYEEGFKGFLSKVLCQGDASCVSSTIDKDSASIFLEGIGYLPLSALAVPLAPLVLPVYLKDKRKGEEFIKQFNALPPGISKDEIVKMIGQPVKAFKSQKSDYEVLIYMPNDYGMISIKAIGLRGNKLEWLYGDFDYEKLIRGGWAESKR